MAGIQVRRAVQKLTEHELNLEDMVIFTDSLSLENRVFIADQAFDNPRRIRRARLLLDNTERNRLLDLFEHAWSAAPVVSLQSLEVRRELGDVSLEPAYRMKSVGLAKPVVTCQEAAAAKCINLENELKTLILRTSRGYVALNLPGNSDADLRKVKAALEVSEACMASPDELLALGLSPGTVCAVKRPVWDLPFLISTRLLRLSFVSTNDGTLRGFYTFEPSILQDAPSVMLGDFEAPGTRIARQIRRE